MSLPRRRLPHDYLEGRALFLTWHLHGRAGVGACATSGPDSYHRRAPNYLRMFLPLTLILVGTCLASTSLGAAEGKIAGLVRSVTTGAPVRSAVVALRPLSQPKGVTRTAVSGPEGGFEFARVPAGRYEFSLTKTGFQTLRGLSTRVSLREDQQLTGLAFQLWPNGAVSGVVFDPEGEPLPRGPRAGLRGALSRNRHEAVVRGPSEER